MFNNIYICIENIKMLLLLLLAIPSPNCSITTSRCIFAGDVQRFGEQWEVLLPLQTKYKSRYHLDLEDGSSRKYKEEVHCWQISQQGVINKLTFNCYSTVAPLPLLSWNRHWVLDGNHQVRNIKVNTVKPGGKIHLTLNTYLHQSKAFNNDLML